MKKTLLFIVMVFPVSSNVMATDPIVVQKQDIAPIQIQKPNTAPKQIAPTTVKKAPINSVPCPGNELECDPGYKCMQHNVQNGSGTVYYSCEKRSGGCGGMTRSDCQWDRI